MEFQYKLPGKIIFGRGKINELDQHLESMGDKYAIVSGSSAVKNGYVNQVKTILSGKTCVGEFLVGGEPSCDDVDRCRDLLKEDKPAFVIGIGGGSALDVAKASAGLYDQVLETEKYLNKEPFVYKGIPFIGIPTSSGTGSEVTLNSVLYNPSTGNKASIAHENFQAHLALVDPELSYSMPKSVVAASGMDALTHAIESHVSKVSNIGTKLYTIKAIELIGSALKDAVDGDKEALDALALGSLYAAMGFAQTGVGVAHAISHPLGAIFHMPHGVANAILLKEACWFNEPSNPDVFGEIKDALGCKNLYEYLNNLLSELPIPQNLKSAGYESGHEASILEKTFQSRSLKKNPREASESDILVILERCMG